MAQPMNYQKLVENALESNEDYIKATQGVPQEVINEMIEFLPNITEKFHLFRRKGITAANIKLDIKYCMLSEQFTSDINKKKLYVPLNAFFYPYTINCGLLDPDDIDSSRMEGNVIIISINTDYGPFYFIASRIQDEGSTNTVSLINGLRFNDRPGCIPTVEFIRSARAGTDTSNTAILGRIEPYICVNCGNHRPKMKKCQGCWDNLGICVRYCSPECQRIDYKRNHRFFCGCKPNCDAQVVRQKEFDERSEKAQRLTAQMMRK